VNRSERERVAVAFGAVLRFKRNELGMSQEQLADQADLDRTYPSLIERGLRQPTITVLIKISAALNLTPEVLLQMTSAKLRDGHC
jgi:transcriptional regulator with XRE-family HTH domain